MKFDYQHYVGLLNLLQKQNYHITDYHNWRDVERCVILRHDVDNDLEKALSMAKLEQQYHVKSTYFILITSNFYNILSKDNTEKIRRIQSCGHEIGLHFDEMAYPGLTLEERIDAIRNEAKILETVTGRSVSTVSMHRPSREFLESDMEIPNMINSYSKTFFHEFKYLSDSRRNWREPVEEIIQSEAYSKLHILTHAFWYGEQEQSMHDRIYSYVNNAGAERYQILESNITDLASIMKREEIH